MAMLGYATVGSNNLEKAKDFYDALLGSVGVVGQFEHPTGGRIYGRDGVFFFGVLGPYNKQLASVGNGCMFAFKFDTREEVDAFYAKALALGGTDEGPPGYRGPTYYFSYFRDLEGNKLCAYSIG